MLLLSNAAMCYDDLKKNFEKDGGGGEWGETTEAVEANQKSAKSGS